MKKPSCKGCAVGAGILFILLPLLILAEAWAYASGNSDGFQYARVLMNWFNMVLYGADLLMAFACFRLGSGQKMTALFAVGFGLQMAADLIYVRNMLYADAGMLYPLLLLAAHGAMFLLFLLTRGEKKGAAKLWFLPGALMLLANIAGGHLPLLYHLARRLLQGRIYWPEVCSTLTMLCDIAALFLLGLALYRFCKEESAPVYAPEEPVYAPEEPAYAPEEPVYAPEEPVYDADTEKKLTACRDLLDSGLLTREEYEEQVYKLTHRGE